jgi:hypothetical protein
LHAPAEKFSMRLLTDPQPAIEWFCTGGSVCIGIEEERRDPETAREPRVRAAATFTRPVRFPAAKGEA